MRPSREPNLASGHVTREGVCNALISLFESELNTPSPLCSSQLPLFNCLYSISLLDLSLKMETLGPLDLIRTIRPFKFH